MSLDHGTLNLPLSKRGDIDAQLDRYKADQASKATAERKEKAAALRALKAEAKQALVDIKAVAGLLDAKAAEMGVSKAKLVAHLTDWSKWQPANLIRARKQWVGETK